MTLDRLKTLVDRRGWLYQKLPAAAYFGRAEYGDAVTYRLKAPKQGYLCYYAWRTDAPDVPEVVILSLLMQQIEEHILDD